MKKLLSLPPNLVACFHEIERADRKEWFCTSDPIGHKLGSGGGTAWLLQACKASETDEGETFAAWLSREKRILLHAGGQSRRLPAYAPSGKILTPVPGTTLGPESVVAAITPLRADYGACAAFVAYVDSQWRRVYPYRPAFAGHPRGRCGVLRDVGRPEPGSKPWGIRIGPPVA